MVISWAYFGYVFGIIWNNFFGIYLAKLSHILKISWVYLGHMVSINRAYLGHIMGNSWAYFGHILGISWAQCTIHTADVVQYTKKHPKIYLIKKT